MLAKVPEDFKHASLVSAQNDQNIYFDGVNEPLTDVEVDNLLPQVNPGYNSNTKITLSDLDAAFGSLSDPLTEWETDDEGERNDATCTKARKRRRGRGRNPNHIRRRVKRLATTLVALAQKKANTVIFNNFSFLEATNDDTAIRNNFQKSLVPPQDRIVWGEENVYRRAMSIDGYDLIYHFPGAVTQKEMLSRWLVDYGSALGISVKPTADRFHRNKPNSYVQREGEIAGVVHLVRCWHGIGRPDLDMVVSKDFIKSGKAFHHSMQLLQQLQIFSHSINAFLEAIDPIQCACLKAARDEAERKYAYVNAVDKLDPLLMEGRAIMWNRMTPEHKDERDPLVAWAALVVLGWIRSGSLFFRQLNLKVRYQPGDIVWLRGALLDHEVEVWEGEQRICVAHFTHKSYFQDLGLVCLTAPGVVPTDSFPLPPVTVAESERYSPFQPPAKKRASSKESQSLKGCGTNVQGHWRKANTFTRK